MEGAKKTGKAYVGTSGWSYDDWVVRFYPEDVRKKDWFEYFVKHFSTVELNATYYRLFPAKTFQLWHDKAPKNFTYAVKMWRMVTHLKRLRDADDATQTVLERAALLGRNLGPILVQLPPSLRRDDELLDEYLLVLRHIRQAIGMRMKFAFEFRHASWMDDAVYAILKRHRAALCLPDGPQPEWPRVVTSNFTYVRFHGRPNTDSMYTEPMLAEWAQWMKPKLSSGIDVYAYFNDDYKAHAVVNARQLRELLKVKNL